MKTYTLDVSEMEAPEPLRAVLSALAENPEQILIVQHRLRPEGLFKKLREMRRPFHTEKKSDCLFLITIYPENPYD